MKVIFLLLFCAILLFPGSIPAFAQSTEPPPGSIPTPGSSVPNVDPTEGTVQPRVTGDAIPTPDQKKFVPLAGLPGFTDNQANLTLPALLQALYRLAIVIGAMIAVLKITLAGFKYMGSDSIGSKASAKEDIKAALLGLLILLATALILETVVGRSLNFNFLSNAPQVAYRPVVTPIITPPAPGTTGIVPSKGCQQTNSGSCQTGNVAIFKGAGVGCAPANAIPKPAGQSTFSYMTESQCSQSAFFQGASDSGKVSQLIADGKSIYGYLEVRRGATQPTTDSLLNDCKAAGGSRVEKTGTAYYYPWQILTHWYGYVCTN